MFAVLLAVALVSQPKVQWDNTPVWAAQVAAADIETLPADQATRTRYLFLASGSKEELAATSFVLNSVVTRVNVGILPGTSPGAVPLAGGKILRLDLGVFATDEANLAGLLNTWEKFTLVERDFTVKTIVAKKVSVPRYRASNGKFYDFKVEDVTIRGPAVYVDEPVTKLFEFTGSEVPIIDSRLFRKIAMTNLEGGLYYEFRGIKPDTKLKGYLANRGASEEQVKVLESLEKSVQMRSKVTGKERMISVFRGAGVRPSVGGGLVSLTFDPFDEDREEQSPIRNLLNFRGRGSEVIIELSNGMHEWTLWDDAGNSVRSAPDKLVADHTIPSPFTQILQPGISCVVCHASESGWRTADNDVQKVLSSGVNIFGDLSSKEDLLKQSQLLAGLYTGPSWFKVGTGPFAVGRLTYTEACARVTGLSAQEVATLMGRFRDAYEYTDLDIWAVANELGIVGITPSDGKPETEADMLAALAEMRPIIGAIPPHATINGIVAEDAVAATILAGVPVSRRTFDTVKGILMTRAYSRMAQ